MVFYRVLRSRSFTVIINVDMYNRVLLRDKNKGYLTNSGSFLRTFDLERGSDSFKQRKGNHIYVIELSEIVLINQRMLPMPCNRFGRHTEI